MKGHLPLALGFVVALARPAVGAELLLGWDADVIWDSNVFRTPDQTPQGDDIPKDDDFSLRTGPNIRFRELRGDLQYDLSYSPRYEEFARLDGIGEFDHFASGSGSWQITRQTTLRFDDDFGYSSSLGGIFEAVPATVGAIVVAPARERITTNTARAGVVHRLGPLWELSFEGSHDFFDFESEGQSDSFSLGGTAQLTRSMTPRLLVGGGAQVQRQEFSGGIAEENENGTTFYQVFGVVNYRISPTWNVSINAGPAYSDPDQPTTFDTVEVRDYFAVDPSTCPRRADGTAVILLFPERQSDLCQPARYRLASPPPGSSGDTNIAVLPSDQPNRDVPFVGNQDVEGSLTYFGRVSMDKTWRNWVAAISYQRSASAGSGLSTSTTLDLLSAELRWKPGVLWSLSLIGTISQQSAVNEVLQREIALRPREIQDEFFVQGVGPTDFVATVGDPFEVSTGDPIDNSLDVRQYRVELRGERRITRNLVLDGSASWWQQTTRSGQLDVDRTIYRVLLGLTWTFDPIPL